MPCYQSNPVGVIKNPGAFATEADCLQACKEGACCESNGTCSVKPQCQCQGTGQTFRGVGTVCTANLCGCCGGGESLTRASLSLSWSIRPVNRWCLNCSGSYPCTNPVREDGTPYGFRVQFSCGCLSWRPCLSDYPNLYVDQWSDASGSASLQGVAGTCSQQLQGTLTWNRVDPTEPIGSSQFTAIVTIEKFIPSGADLCFPLSSGVQDACASSPQTGQQCCVLLRSTETYFPFAWQYSPGQKTYTGSLTEYYYNNGGGSSSEAAVSVAIARYNGGGQPASVLSYLSSHRQYSNLAYIGYKQISFTLTLA